MIHYCWFGRKPLPKSAQKCIDSWRKYFPDYEIKQWNEDNFDVNIIPYTAEAYRTKKYAFVSDYARIWILYNHGGIYFDTDVEVIRSMKQILDYGPFMGCEIDGGNDTNITINPGLGIAASSGMTVYKEILSVYNTLKFLLDNGRYNLYAIVRITTDILKQHGLKNIMGQQQIAEMTIYPAEFFNPVNSLTGECNITNNTLSIHQYANTWSSPMSRLKNFIGRKLRRLIHGNFNPFRKK